MKYAVIDQTIGDWFVDLFDTLDQAIARADYEWHIMAPTDKKRRVSFFVASCEVDEDGCIDWDTVNTVKEYK